MSYNLDNVQKTFINSNSILIETTGTFSNNLFLTEDITVYNTNIINLTENVTGSIQYNDYTTFNSVNGSQGYMGPQGDSNGSQGFMGFQGDIGYQGNLGYQGVFGFQGNIGFQGFQGVVGNQGYIGNQGVIGQQMVIFAYTGNLNGVSVSSNNIGQYAVVNKDLYVYNGTGFTLCTQLFRENEGGQGRIGFQGNLGFQGQTGFQGLKGQGGDIFSYNSFSFTGLNNGMLYLDDDNVLNGSRVLSTGGSMDFKTYYTKATGTQLTLNTINRYGRNETGAIFNNSLYVHSTGTTIAVTAGTGVGSDIYYITNDGYNYTHLNSGATGFYSSIWMSENTQYISIIERTNGICKILVSNDYGKSFSSNAPSSPSGPYYNTIYVSSSGQYQLAGTYTLFTGGIAIEGINTGLWRSSNYGITWDRVTGLNYMNRCTSIKMSKSGQYQVALDAANVYHSWNYGQTFFTRSGDYGNTRLAMSDDGSTIYVPRSSDIAGRIARSVDYGNSYNGFWGRPPNSSYIHFIECSSDGNRLLVSAPGNYSTYWDTRTGPYLQNFGILRASSRDLKTSISYLQNYNQISYNTINSFQLQNKNIGVSLSNDGSKQVIIQNIGNIYVSSNTGTSFSTTTINLNRSWYDVSMDGNGNYYAAVGLYITTSSDGGITWTDKNSIREWRGVSISTNNGQYQTAVAYNDYIYISSDYGANFSPVESVRNWNSVSISGNGQYQTAVVFGGQIYTSSDYGVNWTPRDSNRNWRRVSVSPNGMYQTAIVNDGYIYTSSDYGVNWTQRDSQRYWNYISVTDNMQVACASDFFKSVPDYIYISRNNGVKWEQYGEQDYWICVSMSTNNLTMTALKFTDIAQHRFTFDDSNFFNINNTTRFIGLDQAIPAANLHLGTANARKLTTTTWLTGSDQRVKENIEDADIDLCYNNVKNINLKRYRWKEEYYPELNDRNSVGFIAQEVEQVFPKAVSKADEYVNNQLLTDFRTFDADQIYKCMYGGLQKCIEKIEDLKNRQKKL